MPAPIPVSKDFKIYRPTNSVANKSRSGLVSLIVMGMLTAVIVSAAVLLIRQYTG